MCAANGKGFQRKQNPWREGQCAKASGLFSGKTLDLQRRLSIAPQHHQVAGVSCSATPLSTLPGLVGGRRLAHFCWGRRQSYQPWGEGWGRKKSQKLMVLILPLPLVLAQRRQGTCQRSKCVPTPRPSSSKQESISCPTYLPAFHRHFLSI